MSGLLIGLRSRKNNFIFVVFVAFFKMIKMIILYECYINTLKNDRCGLFQPITQRKGGMTWAPPENQNPFAIKL